MPITVWVTDEGPKLNLPERTGRGRGAAGRGRGGDAAAAGGDAAAAARGAAAGGAAAGRGAAGGGRGAAAAGAAAEFQPPPPIAVSWTKFRGPGDVKFDKVKPSIDKADGRGRHR